MRGQFNPSMLTDVDDGQMMCRPSCDALWHICIVLITVLVAGCSGSQGPQRFDVSGMVTLDGQPVPKGMLTLVPATNTMGPAAGCDIIDGKYHIAKAKGPIAGEYIFQFTGASDKPSGQFLEIKGGVKEALMLPIFPDKYGSSSTEVRKIDKDSHSFDFNLTSK